MHYLLSVPELEERAAADDGRRRARRASVEAARRRSRRSSRASTRSATTTGRASATGCSSLVMLNVLDEKWKDHLYDLDQLRSAIHYRSWGQKDPLIEYKQEAYTMFVDLMNDIYNTFTERFLRAQLVFNQPRARTRRRRWRRQPPTAPRPAPSRRSGTTRSASSRTFRRRAGVAEERRRATATGEAPRRWMSARPSRRSRSRCARQDPMVVGAGRRASLSDATPARRRRPADWTNVGRNDPCPCGSGKKFKKCHGAQRVARGYAIGR